MRPHQACADRVAIVNKLERAVFIALAWLPGCGTHSPVPILEPQEHVAAQEPWRDAANAAAAYLAAIPGGAAALVERARQADLPQAPSPAGIASRSPTTAPPDAAEVLNLALRARAADVSAAAPDAAGRALLEVQSRCASVSEASLCLGPDVGRAQLVAILALAGHTAIRLEAHPPVPWDSVRYDEHGNEVPTPPLLAYDVPVPPGFHLVPWDPLVDGTESRRFEGDDQTAMAGAVVTVRTPDSLFPRSETSSVPCSVLDITLGARVAQAPVVTEVGGPDCARVGQTHAAWVEDPTRPLIWTVTVPAPGKLRLARMAGEVASMEAWPLFSGIPRPVPRPDVAEANLTGLAAGAPASMPTSDGWVSVLGPRHDWYERTRWVNADRPGWQVTTLDAVHVRPSGALTFFSPERDERPRTSVPREFYAPPDPALLDAALAEVERACPQLAPLAEGALPDPDDCREQEGFMDCEVEASGSVRRFVHASSGNGIGGGGVATWCALDLATCTARVVRTGADNIDASAGYAVWASHADAPHPADFPTWEAIAWPRTAHGTFPGAPTLTGRPRGFDGGPTCRPRIGFGSVRVRAGDWQPGPPSTIPARLVRMGGAGPVSTSLGGVLRENGTRYSALHFRPRARHGALVFYTSERHRYGGEVLGVHDESTDRHRILFDAKTSVQRGNIQLHDVVGSELLFSISPDPRADFPYPPAYVLLDIASGAGRSLDGSFLHPASDSDGPEHHDDEVPVEAGDYGAPVLGASMIQSVDGAPTLVAAEWVGTDDETPCERRARLSDLSRARGN